MTEFIEYKKSRKDLIQYTKNRLKTVRPTINKHGSKIPALKLDDYIIYAALRGMDYHKVAKGRVPSVDYVMDRLIGKLDMRLMLHRMTKKDSFVPDTTYDSMVELVEILKSERQKWAQPTK